MAATALARRSAVSAISLARTSSWALRYEGLRQPALGSLRLVLCSSGLVICATSPIVFDLNIAGFGFGAVFNISMVAAAMLVSAPSTLGQSPAVKSLILLSAEWV